MYKIKPILTQLHYIIGEITGANLKQTMDRRAAMFEDIRESTARLAELFEKCPQEE